MRRPAARKPSPKAVLPTPTEAVNQEHGRRLLVPMGYVIMTTGAQKSGAICVKCSRTQHRSVHGVCPSCGGSVHSKNWGNTLGLPDWMLTHPKWPANVWMSIEWKRDPKADVREGQQALLDAGRTVIAYDLWDAAYHVFCFEQDHPFIHVNRQLAMTLKNSAPGAIARTEGFDLRRDFWQAYAKTPPTQ